MFTARKQFATIFSLMALVGLSACSDDDPISAVTPALNWSSCGEDSTLDCANLQVPVDYQQADGDMINIALNRLTASGPNRLGALLFNPGGPGGSGIEVVESLIELQGIPESILAAYDIVGFDPRGIGDSTPVDCTDLGSDGINVYPTDAADVASLHTQLSTLASACSEKHGDYLLQLGSLNVVRDMEEIRKALGDDKLNFIGYSYGTRLAALYLQEYPASSGRIVLDGSVLPDSSVLPLAAGALPQMQKNLQTVLSQCVTSDTECDADALLTTLNQRINDLLTDASEAAEQELDLLGELVISASQDPVFGDFAATPLADYLRTLDITPLVNFITQLESIAGEDVFEDSDNETALTAVLCADDATRPDIAELSGLLDEYNLVSDVFAEAYVALAASCAGWPAAVEPLAVISSNTAPVSLVIGGSTDAQTPIAWSEIMAQAIGGVFIRSDHPGHTSVFNEESQCIDAIVEAFLLDGQVPATLECPAES